MTALGDWNPVPDNMWMQIRCKLLAMTFHSPIHRFMAFKAKHKCIGKILDAFNENNSNFNQNGTYRRKGGCTDIEKLL